MTKYDVSVGPVTVGPANKMRSRALMDAIMRAKQAASPEQEVDQKMEDARLLTGMGNEPSYGMEDVRMMARDASLEGAPLDVGALGRSDAFDPTLQNLRSRQQAVLAGPQVKDIYAPQYRADPFQMTPEQYPYLMQAKDLGVPVPENPKDWPAAEQNYREFFLSR